MDAQYEKLALEWKKFNYIELEFLPKYMWQEYLDLAIKPEYKCKTIHFHYGFLII
jgi:hypothetical protein